MKRWLMQALILQVRRGRILIDFLDPLVVSRKIATTDNTKFVTINEIAFELKDGTKAVNGKRSIGKRRVIQG